MSSGFQPCFAMLSTSSKASSRSLNYKFFPAYFKVHKSPFREKISESRVSYGHRWSLSLAWPWVWRKQACVWFPGAEPRGERLWWALRSHRERGCGPHSSSHHRSQRNRRLLTMGPQWWGPVWGRVTWVPARTRSLRARPQARHFPRGWAMGGRVGAGGGRRQQKQGSCVDHSHGCSELPFPEVCFSDNC